VYSSEGLLRKISRKYAYETGEVVARFALKFSSVAKTIDESRMRIRLLE
jgi:hypothetical protein